MHKKTWNLMLLIGVVALVVGVYGQHKPQGDDETVCREAAAARGVEFKSAEKEKELDCRVKCAYSDSSNSVENSRNEQVCDALGVGPTGRCKNGECTMSPI